MYRFHALLTLIVFAENILEKYVSLHRLEINVDQINDAPKIPHFNT